jgi:hypothetical protein
MGNYEVPPDAVSSWSYFQPAEPFEKLNSGSTSGKLHSDIITMSIDHA